MLTYVLNDEHKTTKFPHTIAVSELEILDKKMRKKHHLIEESVEETVKYSALSFNIFSIRVYTKNFFQFGYRAFVVKMLFYAFNRTYQSLDFPFWKFARDFVKLYHI